MPRLVSLFPCSRAFVLVVRRGTVFLNVVGPDEAYLAERRPFPQLSLHFNQPSSLPTSAKSAQVFLLCASILILCIFLHLFAVGFVFSAEVNMALLLSRGIACGAVTVVVLAGVSRLWHLWGGVAREREDNTNQIQLEVLARSKRGEIPKRVSPRQD